MRCSNNRRKAMKVPLNYSGSQVGSVRSDCGSFKPSWALQVILMWLHTFLVRKVRNSDSLFVSPGNVSDADPSALRIA